MKQSLSSESDCFSASQESYNFAELQSSSPCFPETTTGPALSHMLQATQSYSTRCFLVLQSYLRKLYIMNWIN